VNIAKTIYLAININQWQQMGHSKKKLATFCSLLQIFKEILLTIFLITSLPLNIKNFIFQSKILHHSEKIFA